ncbi:MAG: acetylxylan esterase [Planctomycetota bacterium]|nr:acetylxylan esterase [Planctomycetota bacterium]
MLTFGPRVDGYYDVEDQLIHYLRRRAEAAFRRREREREALTSIEAFEARRAQLRETFLKAIGGLPSKRAPLNAKVAGTLDRGAYEIEKILYESLPNFPVTANLYVPKSRRGAKPGPAVLFVCGHAEEAKAYPKYQQVCIDLALDGFVVLAVDPPGQGERFQFIDESTGEQRVRWGTTEHSYAGFQYYMAGMSIARQFVWDGSRGIDYLVERPEVDAKKIGVTGNSGGGTQSVFLMLAEPRLAAAMPCTFVMDYESYLKTGQPQDGEQNHWAGFADGPDHDEYLSAMAPRPVRVGLAAYDFFPIEGSLAAIERARKAFALYGAEKHLDYAVAPTTHQYSPKLREAAVNFFRRALRGEEETFKTQEPEPLPQKDLWVTEHGQVLRSVAECHTVSSLLRKEIQLELPLSPRVQEPEALRADLAGVLGIGAGQPDGEAQWKGAPRERVIYPRVIQEANVHGYRCEKLFFFAEPDVVLTAILCHPRREERAAGAELLLLPEGTAQIPQERSRLIALLERNRRVCVLDVRGIGAVRSRGIGRAAETHGTEWKLGCDAMKLRISTLGLRVFDVLRGFDYLRSRFDAGEVAVSGVGIAGAWALYAAVLEPRLAALSLEGMPLSFRFAAEDRFYDPEQVNFLTCAWGILRVGDVVDMLPALKPRPVRIDRPMSPRGRPLTTEEVGIEFLNPATEIGLIGEKASGWTPAITGLADR